MQNNQTDPAIQSGISHGLRHWFDDDVTQPYSGGLHEVYAAQTRAGWHCFIDGFIHPEWMQQQQQYLQWLGSRRTANRWMEQLIRMVWQIAWDMWGHRMRISQKNDAASELATAAALDATITDRYQQLPQPCPTHLTQWFQDDLNTILEESNDFKEQWVELVDQLQRR